MSSTHPRAAASPRRPSRRRLAIFATLSPLVLLLLVEGGLRGGGAWVAARHARTTETLRGDGDLAIWAFGDSYTFGIGADEPARDTWPMVVAAALEASTGRTTSVRNEAEPGANSTEIVERLEAALEAGPAPALVLVLAGVNNSRWLGRSGQFCLDEGGDAAAGPVASLTRRLGGLRSYALLRNVVLSLRPPADAAVACARIAEGFQQLDDGYPDRAEAAFQEALVTQPESAWAELGVGLARTRIGEHAIAIAHLDRARDRGVAPPALAIARGFALRNAGRAVEALVEAKAHHPGDLAPFGRILEGWVLWDAGDLGPAAATFRGVVEAGDREGAPGGPSVWALDGLGWSLLARGDVQAAHEAFSRAVALGDALHLTPHLMGWSDLGLGIIAGSTGDLTTARARFERASGDTAAVANAMAALGWVLARDVSAIEARQALRKAEILLPGLPIADALRAALEGLPNDATVTLAAPLPLPTPTIAIQQWLDPADTRLVRADLERAATAAARAGARLVLTTYPAPRAHPELAEAAAAVAGARGLLFVDPRPAFQAEFERLGSWSPLMIDDGHPTTRGYQLMGTVVADAIRVEDR